SPGSPMLSARSPHAARGDGDGQRAHSANEDGALRGRRPRSSPYPESRMPRVSPWRSMLPRRVETRPGYRPRGSRTPGAEPGYLPAPTRPWRCRTPHPRQEAADQLGAMPVQGPEGLAAPDQDVLSEGWPGESRPTNQGVEPAPQVMVDAPAAERLPDPV